MRWTVATFLAIGTMAAAHTERAAWAEDIAQYPSRSIKLVVPASAGASSDITGRVLAAGIGPLLGQPVVVEDIVGAASVAGTAAVAKAAPDGYTLLVDNIAPIGVAPLYRKDLPYDPTRDLTPVSEMSENSFILVVNPSIPAKTVTELVKLLKDNPGKYNFGTSGVGASQHLAMELFMLKTGTKMVHVPYKGSQETAAALIAGQVDLAINSSTAFMPLVEAGKARALAVANPKRAKDLPDLPTISEFVPAFPGYTSWLGIFAPGGTPPAIIAKLNKVMVQYLNSPDGIAKMKNLSATATSSSPEELGERVRTETASWAQVFKEANIHIE